MAQGRVAWPALKMYFLAIGGWSVWTTVLLGCLGASATNIAQPWWLGEWARQYERQDSSQVSVS